MIRKQLWANLLQEGQQQRRAVESWAVGSSTSPQHLRHGKEDMSSVRWSTTMASQ